MNNNDIIFSSDIDSDVENICFDILADALSQQNFQSVYVSNVVLAPNQIIFFADIQGIKNILRIETK